VSPRITRRVETRSLGSNRQVADKCGSEGTPYAGGYFRVKFKFTEEFPAAPPKCASPSFTQS
jgi:ubiquitin-protein ligase